MATVLVDAYDGRGTHFYWDKQGMVDIKTSNRSIIISGNKPFLMSFAKQMLYLASNDFCLPFGTHLHYDQAFGHHYTGPELVLELIPATSQGIVLDTVDSLSVNVNLPICKEQLHQRWCPDAKIFISNTDSVYILANYQGLMFMATVLLFIIENNDETVYRCGKTLFPGWEGCDLVFALLD